MNGTGTITTVDGASKRTIFVNVSQPPGPAAWPPRVSHAFALNPLNDRIYLASGYWFTPVEKGFGLSCSPGALTVVGTATSGPSRVSHKRSATEPGGCAANARRILEREAAAATLPEGEP